jgi:hypothetical protein
VEHDLAAQGGAAYWLAYAHPAFMLVALGCALAALRIGLALRRARRLGARRDGGVYVRHLRNAKLAAALLPLGFAGGVASAAWLRGWNPLESAHGWVASTTLALFLATAFFGRRLERGAGDPHDVHALLAVAATLGAAAAAFTGFALLP